MLSKKEILVVLFTSTALYGCGNDDNAMVEPPEAVNSAPIAAISVSSSVDEKSEVQIDGSTSTDSDGTISSYQWSLDAPDAVNVELESNNQSQTKLIVGEIAESVTITVNLVVTDNDGANGTTDFAIEISELDFTLLPPDPGISSLETLDGIDMDEDGIRDDVEHGIYNLFPLDTEMRKIGEYGAKGLQMALSAGDTVNDVDSDIAATELAIWAGCMVEMQIRDNKDISFADIEMSAIKELVYNTPERINARRDYEKLRAGTAIRIELVDIDTCVFE